MNSRTTFKADSYAELEWLTEDHHKRWDVSSLELGVSLHAMRQLGHWPPEDTNNVQLLPVL
jgi:hypothetical protein